MVPRNWLTSIRRNKTAKPAARIARMAPQIRRSFRICTPHRYFTAGLLEPGSGCGRIDIAMRSFLTLTVALLAGVTTAHPADCDRACLRDFVTQYLDAMLTHNPATLPLGA